MDSDHDTIVGHVLIERGIVTRDQFVECLREAGSDTGSGSTTRLTDLLIAKGYLDEDQLTALRFEVDSVLSDSSDIQVVRKEDALLGRLLVDRKAVTEEQLKECLALQATEAKGPRAPRLGELLIKRGYCTFDAVEDALKAQAGHVNLVCASCSSTVAVRAVDPARKYVCKKCSGSLVKEGARPEASTGVPRGGKELPEAAQRAMRNPKNQFGKYWLIRELGRGGMGAVYQAWDGSLNRMVAIKVLLAQRGRDEIERFLREAQTAADLRHPNIVAVYETGLHDGRNYIAMEFLEGKQLDADRVPIRKACEIVKAVALALDFAHQKDVIHRDIKPQNIMLDRKGVPHVMDFGLAKSLTAESAITATGTIIGTPSYMPPEQAEGRNRKLDRRVDIYSLGAVLYEMLTGRPPFKGATPVETLKQVLDDEPTPPSKLNPAVPRDVENIVLKCLEKDRNNRYQTAAALARDLARYLEGEAVSARSLNVVERAAKKVRRNKLIVAAAVVLVAVPLIAIVMVARAGSERAAEVERRFGSATSLYDKKKYSEARAELAAALALDPGNRRLVEWTEKCDEAIATLKVEADAARAKAERDADEKKRRDEQVRREFDEHVRTGDLRADARDWEAARLAYEKAMAVGRDLAAARAVETKLAAVKKTLDEIAEARRKELEQLQASDADRQRKLAEAQPEFDNGKRKLENADKDLYRPGADLSRTHKLAEEAIAHFDKAIGIFPRHHEAYLLRGKARALRYEYTEAIADYTKAIAVLKTFSGAYWERGRLYLQVYLDLMTSRGWRGFAQSETAAAWLAKALPDLNEARRLGLGDETELAAAYIAYANDNMPNCLELCDRVLAKNDSKEEAWKLKGDALYRTALRGGGDVRAKLTDALECYSTAIRNRANYADAYIMRGAVNFETGQPDQAGADFEKAIAINPKNSWAHNAIAIYYQHRKDPKTAMTHLDKAVELDPAAPRAWADRSQLKMGQSDFAGALADADKALQVNPEYAIGWYVRGACRARDGKHKDAIADLEKALELGHPARNYIQQLIGQIRQRMGE